MGLTESPEDLGMDPSISRILGGSCGTQCWLWPSRAHCGVSARGHGETLSLEMSWPGDGCSLRSSESRGSVIFRMGVTRRSWETKRSLSSLSYLIRNQALARQSRKPTRRHRHREMRAFFSCVAWRGIPSPLSKQHRRLDSLYVTLPKMKAEFHASTHVET